jgi:hypothetical protein
MLVPVELKGRINEHGKLEIDLPENLLPPGDVLVTIEPVEEDADIEAEDAVWDEFYANASEEFDALAHKAHENYLAGRAKKIDTKTDFDSQ